MISNIRHRGNTDMPGAASCILTILAVVVILWYGSDINIFDLLDSAMARSCDICGRGPHSVVRRSHAMNKTLAQQNINLQKRRIDGKKQNVCTTCIKSNHFHPSGTQKG